MRYWLMKSEPDAFSIKDLKKMKNSTSCWDGVRNYQARNFMRDEMKLGDELFFYHSSCKQPGIVGTAKIVKEAYPDHTALDKKSKYYDPKSSEENPRWFMVDIKLKREFKNIISLTTLKASDKLNDFKLLQKGNRLSIIPVSKENWDTIMMMES